MIEAMLSGQHKSEFCIAEIWSIDLPMSGATALANPPGYLYGEFWVNESSNGVAAALADIRHHRKRERHRTRSFAVRHCVFAPSARTRPFSRVGRSPVAGSGQPPLALRLARGCAQHGRASGNTSCNPCPRSVRQPHLVRSSNRTWRSHTEEAWAGP